MTTAIMQVASLTRLVEESFSDSVSPGEREEDIFAVYDLDIPQFMEMIKSKDWKGFLRVLETSEFALSQFYGQMVSFMTPKAFHYFAPAFLIFSMNEEADMVPIVFFGHLYPDPKFYRGQPERVRQLVALFSEPQKRAIALVVDYYSGSMYPFNSLQGFTGWCSRLRFYWRRWMV